MKKLFTMLLLLVASSPLFAQKDRCWEVTNTSNPNFGSCPYQVYFSMVLVNSSNQVVPNSGVSVTHTIGTGAADIFCYPNTVPAGYTVRVTQIRFSVNSVFYDLPVDQFQSYYGVSACTAPPCNASTFWQPVGPRSYTITGDCLLSGG